MVGSTFTSRLHGLEALWNKESEENHQRKSSADKSLRNNYYHSNNNQQISDSSYKNNFKAVSRPKLLRGYLIKQIQYRNTSHWQRRFYRLTETPVYQRGAPPHPTCSHHHNTMSKYIHTLEYSLNPNEIDSASTLFPITATTVAKHCPKRPCVFYIENSTEDKMWLRTEKEEHASKWLDTLNQAILYQKSLCCQRCEPTTTITSNHRAYQVSSAATTNTISSTSEKSEDDGYYSSSTNSSSDQALISKFKSAASITKTEKHRFTVGGTTFHIDTRYKFIKVIGSGAYGIVISVYDSISKKSLAIKKIPNVFDDLVDAKRIVREIKLLQHFSHANVIALETLLLPNSYRDLEDIYIVTELMETDLHRIIYSKQALTDAHIQYFLYQTLVSINYIHSSKVLHRDLKPSNLLVNSDCLLKICDFGLARGVVKTVAAAAHYKNNSDFGEASQYVVTRWYRAPELLLGKSDNNNQKQEYSYGIDVWSIGCILGEMLGRDPLFPGKNYSHQLSLIVNMIGKPTLAEVSSMVSSQDVAETCLRAMERSIVDTYRTSFSTLFPDANPLAIDLMEQMLVFDPKKRITVTEALRHPYFKSIRNTFDEVVPVDHDFSFELDDDFHQRDVTKRMLQQSVYGRKARVDNSNTSGFASRSNSSRSSSIRYRSNNDATSRWQNHPQDVPSRSNSTSSSTSKSSRPGWK